MHGNGEHVETDAGRVYVELEGDGPLVILAGGGPGVGHAHYHPWFSRLAERRMVAYVDYPGTGRSGPADDHTLEHYAAALEGIRRHVGAEQTAMVALSFGGLPALGHALAYPGALDALVLSNAQVSAATWSRGTSTGSTRLSGSTTLSGGTSCSRFGPRACDHSIRATKTLRGCARAPGVGRSGAPSAARA